MSLALLAGLLLGVAHLHGQAAVSGWAGVAALAAFLTRAEPPRRRAVGVLLAAWLHAAIAGFWLARTCRVFLELSPWAAMGLALAAWTISALCAAAPLAIAVALIPRRWSVWPWLGPAWAAGEVLRAATSGFAMHDWLAAQWCVPQVLRALAWCGWWPTLLLCLAAASTLGEGLERRDRGLLGWSLSLFATTSLWPPGPSAAPLPRDVAAMQLETYDDATPALDPGVRLVLWPEASLRYWPSAEEGVIANGPQVPLSPSLLGTEHLFGLISHARGGDLNAVGWVDATGRLRAIRAKRTLVPLAERPWLGIAAVGGGFVPGRTEPMLTVAGHRVVPLVCFEVFNRALVDRGVRAGGEVLAVLASDRPFAGSHIAIEQSLGHLVLRSVETRLPALRASLGGSAAIALPDGSLRRLVPGRHGIVVAR